MRGSFHSTYPPESRFRPGTGEAELRDAILRSNEEPIPRPLALSVCCPVGAGADARGDIARLRREIDLVARLVDRDRDVVTLRLEGRDGGQYPATASVRDLADALQHQFHFAPGARRECTLDVDPLDLVPEQLDALAAEGFGHVACGSHGETGFEACGPEPPGECDWLGFGAGAISRVGGWLSRNAIDLAAWRSDIDAGRLSARRGLRLTPDDELRGDLLRHLWCRASIDIGRLERRFAIRFREYFAGELARLAPAFRVGIVRDFGDRIEVCSRGWPWLRSVALCFDAYATAGGRPREVATRPGR